MDYNKGRVSPNIKYPTKALGPPNAILLTAVIYLQTNYRGGWLGILATWQLVERQAIIICLIASEKHYHLFIN
jgi:hypothetical protein